MIPEHEIEYMDAKIKSMLQSFILEPKRVDAMAYDFRIDETAPQASTLDISTDVLVDGSKMNKIMMVIVIPKSGDECPKLTESKHIKLSVTHFKPEPESKHCYYHFYGDGFKLNGMTQEIKMIVRDAIREDKRRKKESGNK
jgi:hypothetical protein